MYYETTCRFPVGTITLASDGTALAGLWLENQKYFGGTLNGGMAQKDDLPIFEKTVNWLERYFSGQNPAIGELPLAPAGKPFRQEVWKLLCDIPYGETTTYGEIAQKMAVKLNKPGMSAQAGGGAVRPNPILIIIPCHRGGGSNGSPTGFSGGIEKKKGRLGDEGGEMGKKKLPGKGNAT